MAVRDKSQGVGFVYTNIYELYKKAQAAAKVESSETLKSTVYRPEDLADVKVARFQPRLLQAVQTGMKKAEEHTSAPAKSLADLKQNIHKLNDLHSKLRFMLKELEDLVGNKKK